MARILLFIASLVVALLSLSCSNDEKPQATIPTADLLPDLVSMNRLPLPEREKGPFRFITLGHLYGQPGLKHDRPAPSFVSSIPRLNALNPELCVLLGDCFYLWKDEEIKSTLKILGTLSCPVINAPGNHDLVVRKMYNKLFGTTYFAFSYRGSRFVILDTELDIWNISDEQLTFLYSELAQCEGDDAPQNLFVFGHKVIWAGTQETVVCAVGGNDPAGLQVFATRPKDRPMFNRDIRPRLRLASKKVPIYWFAGDIGAFRRSIHLFRQEDTKEPGTQLTYLAVGIGDRPRDAALVIDVDKKGQATIRGFEMQTGKFIDMTDHGAAHWDPKILPGGRIPDVFEPYLEK